MTGHALVCVVGRLALQDIHQGTLDFGDGEIAVVGADAEVSRQLSSIGRESIVTVTGTLKRHTWKVASGQQRESFQIVAQRITVVYDARRGRMVL